MDDKADKGAPEEAAAPKKKSALVPMLVASLVMVGAAYATVSFVLKPMLRPDAATAATESQAEEEGKGEIVRFENIIVNPSGTMGSRYLSTTVGLEVTSEAAREAVAEAEPMIKDALITHLSSRTIDELTDAAAREDMRAAIRDLVNQTVAPQKVKAVFFLDFVLQ